jgi:hypothetical protein
MEHERPRISCGADRQAGHNLDAPADSTLSVVQAGTLAVEVDLD